MRYLSVSNYPVGGLVILAGWVVLRDGPLGWGALLGRVFLVGLAILVVFIFLLG